MNNLWIRSQDKKKILNVNAINILEFEDIIAIHGYIDSKTHFWLGKYATKEKTLEILDEIQDLLQNAYVGNSNRIVYQMPEN